MYNRNLYKYWKNGIESSKWNFKSPWCMSLYDYNANITQFETHLCCSTSKERISQVKSIWSFVFDVSGLFLSSTLTTRLKKWSCRSSPPRWKKKWVPASYYAGKVKQTRLCRRSSVPHKQKNKNKILKKKLWASVLTLPLPFHHSHYYSYFFVTLH